MNDPRSLPPPGWYPDPAGGDGVRWWDGRAWSAGVVSAPASRTAPTPGLPTGWGHQVAAGSSGWGRPVDVQAPRGPVGGPAAGHDAKVHPAAWAPSGHPAAELALGRQPGPRQAAGRIPARAAWWALLGIAVGEVLGLIFGGVAYAITGSSSGAATTLVSELGLWAGMLSACLFVSRRYGTRSLSQDYTLGIRTVDVAFGVLAAAGGFVLSSVAGAAFAHTRLAGSNTQLITGQKHNSAGFVVVTVIVAVGAPFFEELFFRGLIRTALASRLGPIGAIWAQAGLFGLAHFQPTTGLGNVSVIIVIGALGVVLGYTAHLTKRLGAGMIGHGLFNTVVSVIVLTT